MSIREKKAEGQFCFLLMLALFVVFFRLQCRTRGDKWHPYSDACRFRICPDKGVYGGFCGLM